MRWDVDRNLEAEEDNTVDHHKEVRTRRAVGKAQDIDNFVAEFDCEKDKAGETR